MGASSCSIQFSHPGREQEPDCTGVETKNIYSHKRKLMEYRDERFVQGGRRRSSPLDLLWLGSPKGVKWVSKSLFFDKLG